MTVGQCKMCQERGQTWAGAPPKCAFPEGVFVTNNWNCATMNAIRDMVERNRFRRFHVDEERIGLIIAPETERLLPGFVVICWYKNRGKNPVARFMDSAECTPLTLERAESVIEPTP